MRLGPIDRPPTIKARVAAWMMKRQLGKVITPARVVYNRVPRMYDVGYALVKFQQRGLVLDPDDAVAGDELGSDAEPLQLLRRHRACLGR